MINKKQEKGLAKVKSDLKDCGLEREEIDSLINFLRFYLATKKGEKK
jgi:hypothetical protein